MNRKKQLTMKKSNRKVDHSCKSEAGISAVVTFIIMTVLAVIGMTVFFITMSDTRMATRKLQTAQTFYLAESGIEYGLKRLNSQLGINEGQAIPITGGTIQLDTCMNGSYTQLTALAQLQGLSRTIRLSLQNTTNLGGFAIYCTGEVDNVTPLDENREYDPSLMVENSDSLPPIDYLGLTDMAINQSHVVYTSPFSPANNYPNGSFYYSPGVPNVTHVIGDLKVQGGRTVYGIFVVEGDVYLHGSSRTEGVIYLPNRNSEVLQVLITGGGTPSESSVVGGIIADGTIDGRGSHITVQYNAEYMGQFGDYERPSETYWIYRWEEL